MTENSKDGILTIDQATKLLKVSSKTIYGLVSNEGKSGKNFAIKVGQPWRVTRKEILIFP